jgi:F-type H+-transporting ATPase subunit b
MELLSALGITSLVFVQFGIFVLMFIYLTAFVFGPYYKAVQERQKQTAGGESLAGEFQQKAADLHSTYQNLARDVNQQIQDIFQKNRTEAMGEYEKIVSRARQESTDLIEKNRKEVAKSVAAASDELRGQSTSVVLSITNKMLGK